MKKGIKIGIIIVAVCVVIAGLLFGLRFIKTPKKNTNVTYMVNRETYENVIEISGTIDAAQKQNLQALSSGTVLAVNVKEGDHVKKGDLILQLDDSTEQYNLAKWDYDMATKRITGSAREIKLMETQRQSLIQKIADRKVVATFDGIIADFDVAVGDSLEPKDTVGTIVNIDYLTAEVEVVETDVQKLVKGQKVIFTFPAYSKDKIEGYVVGWPAIGEITSRGATIVKAKVRIDEFPPEILPNFSFTGKIEISPTVENLVVSRYAIGYEEKQAFVELAKTGEKIKVDVQPYGREYVKIISGLKGGEELKQLTEPKASGFNQKNNGKNGPNNSPVPGFGGMPMPAAGGVRR